MQFWLSKSATWLGLQNIYRPYSIFISTSFVHPKASVDCAPFLPFYQLDILEPRCSDASRSPENTPLLGVDDGENRVVALNALPGSYPHGVM